MFIYFTYSGVCMLLLIYPSPHLSPLVTISLFSMSVSKLANLQEGISASQWTWHMETQCCIMQGGIYMGATSVAVE